MPNDVVTLNAITKELNEFLCEGRIEKVYQPESDEITLTIKNRHKVYTVVVSANPSHPRIHITTQKKENALTAPAFCMLLRKYLVGGFVSGVEIFNSDRIIKLTINAKNELKDTLKYYLMVELMGRYSNIILTSSDMKIIDAIRRIHFDQSTTRYILPNLPYVLQPQNRIPLYDTDALRNFFCAETSPTVESLLKNISGFSKETAAEIVAADSPFDKVQELLNIENKDAYKPCLRYEKGKLCDYYVQPYSTLKGDYETLNSLNECLDKFYLLYDGTERKKASTKTVSAVLKRLQAKTERRIEDNNKKLDDSKKMDNYRLCGELIQTYSYMIKRNDDSLTCTNYYDDTQITIPLDKKLSPSENSQAYFKKYTKAKRAAEIAKEQLENLFRQREYLETIAVSIENCSQKAEYDEILNELNSLDGLRKTPKSVYAKNKATKPLCFKVNGYTVYCGKNNLQNNDVTFNIGDSNDVWLHVKAHHGAHLIIKGKPDDDTIAKCASVAAFYSSARSSPKLEVDYTIRKNVKKIPSAMLGMVTYTNYRTCLVTPADYTEIQDKKEESK